jgi:hypothetical protein
MKFHRKLKELDMLVISIEEKKHTEEDESPCTIKVWICKERCKEAIRKLPGNSDTGVMTVVCCMDG